jgi:hypothetical protein
MPVKPEFAVSIALVLLLYETIPGAAWDVAR